jgi:TonB family protein
MKTKLIFLITVATFSVQAFAIQHNKDKQFHVQMQTQKSVHDWNFKFCLQDTVPAEQKDSIAESEADIEIKDDAKFVCEIGGGSDAHFPGGRAAFNTYIFQNLVLNESDSSRILDGCQTVGVQFTIDETGRITDPIIVKSVGNELDNAVINVIKAMPRWVPASYRGENISMNYTLPIQIYLN